MNSPPSILVIDDDPIEIQFLTAVFRRQDYRVFAAVDGRDGLAKAAAHPPDLILLDLVMPGIDGQATIRLLKAHPQLNPIPVLFLTASADIDDKLSAFAAGAADYITKPFNANEVLARVRVHLRLRAAGAAAEPAAETVAKTVAEAAAAATRDERGGRLVSVAQEILLRAIADPPSLAELASRVGVSERQLSKEFRRRVGMAAYAWLREARHREACFRLLHTRQQLGRIAHEIGYQSAAAFTNAFRARFGMTPREYRNVAGIVAPGG